MTAITNSSSLNDFASKRDDEYIVYFELDAMYFWFRLVGLSGNVI